jgi:hypothetical protein
MDWEAALFSKKKEKKKEKNHGGSVQLYHTMSDWKWISNRTMPEIHSVLADQFPGKLLLTPVYGDTQRSVILQIAMFDDDCITIVPEQSKPYGKDRFRDRRE